MILLYYNIFKEIDSKSTTIHLPQELRSGQSAWRSLYSLYAPCDSGHVVCIHGIPLFQIGSTFFSYLTSVFLNRSERLLCSTEYGLGLYSDRT